MIASLPVGYRIEMGGSIEEPLKANVALIKIFPAIVVPCSSSSFFRSAACRR
ncbi:hypothetical protein AGR4B_pAt20152 [Agrobacterium tumefaciens str. CFBP 5621]|nr:hypothetical protein AGR4B_pAt20152 [Agrobacterium tumefaciens str. CFBP 5621]